MLRLQYYRETGQGHEAKQYEQYLRETNQMQAAAPPAAPKESLRLDVRAPSESTNALPFNRPHPTGDVESLRGAPGALVKPLTASVLTAAQALPGMERFEAAAGAVGSHLTDSPMSYDESLKALRSETDPIPMPIKMALQAPGIIKTAASLALSPAKAGALFGGADQALSANAMSPTERVVRTGIGAGLGGVAGKVGDLGATALRAKKAVSLGDNVLFRKGDLADRDARLYGTAEIEAIINGSTSPKIQQALKDPVVAPFAKAIRGSKTHAGADDATVLREAYKLMSERQRSLGKTMLSADDYKAGSSLERSDIGLAKEDLLKAADPVMPTFRTANDLHRQGAGEIDALQRGSDAVRMYRRTGPGKKLAKDSPEAFSRAVAGMTQGESQAAEEGVLGRLKETIGLRPNAISGFGTLSSIARVNQAAPILRTIGTAKQRSTDTGVRAVASQTIPALRAALRAAGISIDTPSP